MTPLAHDLRAIEAPGTGGTMLRWGTAGLAVATAYAAALWLALAMPPPEGVEGERQDAVMIELEPLTALEDAPPPAPDPESPEQAAAEPAPAPAEPLAPPRPPPPEPEPEPEAEAVPEPVPESTPPRAVAEASPPAPPMPDAPAEPPRSDPAPTEDPEPPPQLDPTTEALVPDLTQTSAIDAAVLNPPIPRLKPPPPPPKAERAPKPRSERPSRSEKPRRSVERPKAVETRRAIAAAPPAALSAAAPRSDTRAASRASQAPRVSAASWQRRAVSHFRKFRRRMDSRERGTARVAVTIDRGGRVVGARLAASSGSPALDGEALALVRRASPIPPPPDGLGGRTLSLTVPVNM